jgi:UDP-N-acetylmuramyl pentapeptide phosphotransferase/UDP-N-acetylglucosamine-1-phosphate transferase
VLSVTCIEAYRRWSVRRGILDHPNERSSHETPTPRGAGLVIFAVSLLAYTVFGFNGFYQFSWVYLFGAILLGIVSWVDDLRTLSFINRMIAHSAAIVLLIADVGYFDSVTLPYLGNVHFGMFGLVLTFLWIFGFLNAFNFMDGIDGIAGSQAFVAAIGWLAVGLITENTFFLLYGCILTAAVLGFLIFNWQPAKIFMGDVGSCFLGFTLAAIPLLTPQKDRPEMLLIAVIFVWPFVFDVIFTFIRRVFLKHRVWRPHREHIYQHLVICGYKHSTITLFYAALAAAGVLCGLMYLSFSGISGILVVFYFVGSAILLTMSLIRSKFDVSLNK